MFAIKKFLFVGVSMVGLNGIAEGHGFPNPTIDAADKEIAAVPLLSAQTQQFLGSVRKTAEMACTGGLGPMAGPESCDVFSKGYADSTKYFIELEKSVGGDLRNGDDMKIMVGQTEEGDAAEVVEAPCDGTGEKSAKNQVSTFTFPTQEYSVVAVLNHAEKCDNVMPNHPQDGILRIDSRNHQKCTFYFVCGGKVEGSTRRSLARNDRKTFRPDFSKPNPTSDDSTGDSSDTSSTANAGTTVSNVGAYRNPSGSFDPNDPRWAGPAGELGAMEGYQDLTGVSGDSLPTEESIRETLNIQ